MTSLVSCSKPDEPQDPTASEELTDNGYTVVLQTDSDEWRVQLFKQHLLYSEAAAVELPAPWIVPTREDAQVLKTLTYGDGSERFITSDGYTFGMPSSSVTKAGSKTKYSVLGLHRRKNVIVVEW
jgi:hypothetical protein